MSFRHDFTEQQIEEAYEILRKATKNKPVKSRELEEKMGLDDADGHPMSRQLIFEVIRRKRLPLGAKSNGYYIIDNWEDLQEYNAKLLGRILGTRDRMYIVNEVFREKYPDKIPEDDEFPEFLHIPPHDEEE